MNTNPFAINLKKDPQILNSQILRAPLPPTYPTFLHTRLSPHNPPSYISLHYLSHFPPTYKRTSLSSCLSSSLLLSLPNPLLHHISNHLSPSLIVFLITSLTTSLPSHLFLNSLLYLLFSIPIYLFPISSPIPTQQRDDTFAVYLQLKPFNWMHLVQ